MKTSKYSNMISAFTCDFELAVEKFSEDEDIGIPLFELTKGAKNNAAFDRDLDLLRELDYGLRHGYIEIHELQPTHYEGEKIV